MSNVEIVTNIDIASEIAHATVTEVLANMENERVSYVLMGVLQQIETIQDNVNNFALKEQDKTTKEVASYYCVRHCGHILPLRNKFCFEQMINL